VAQKLFRAALVVGALVVLAWLAFSLRAVDLQDDAEATVERVRNGDAVSTAEVNDTVQQLQRADRWNPDLTPLIDEGMLLVNADRRNEAFLLADRAVQKEPDNVQAWALMYMAAPNPFALLQAKRRIKQLNPWLGDTLEPKKER
jgi:hypothetical protein